MPLSFYKVEVVQIQIHMFIRLARCCQNVGFTFLGRVTEYDIFGLSEQINRIRTEHWIHRIWFTHPYEGMNHRATTAWKRKDSVYENIGPQLPKGRKDPFSEYCSEWQILLCFTDLPDIRLTYLQIFQMFRCSDIIILSTVQNIGNYPKGDKSAFNH